LIAERAVNLACLDLAAHRSELIPRSLVRSRARPITLRAVHGSARHPTRLASASGQNRPYSEVTESGRLMYCRPQAADQYWHAANVEADGIRRRVHVCICLMPFFRCS